MPTKHIDKNTWMLVEKEHLRAIKAINKPIKESEVFKILILKGLTEIKDKDYTKKS